MKEGDSRTMKLLRNHLNMTVLLCIGCLFVLAPIAFAQDAPQQDQPGPAMQGMRPPGGPGMGLRRPGMGVRGPQMMRREILMHLLRDTEAQKQLNITEEQRKKMEDIVFNNQKAGIQDRANLQVRRLELQRLMQADTPDRAAIDKKLQEVTQAQAALERARINAALDFRAVLTKEQRDKIREAEQKRIRPMQEQRTMQQQRIMQQQRRMQPGAGRPGGGNPPPVKNPGN